MEVSFQKINVIVFSVPRYFFSIMLESHQLRKQIGKCSLFKQFLQRFGVRGKVRGCIPALISQTSSDVVRAAVLTFHITRVCLWSFLYTHILPKISLILSLHAARSAHTSSFKIDAGTFANARLHHSATKKKPYEDSVTLCLVCFQDNDTIRRICIAPAWSWGWSCLRASVPCRNAVRVQIYAANWQWPFRSKI